MLARYLLSWMQFDPSSLYLKMCSLEREGAHLRTHSGGKPSQSQESRSVDPIQPIRSTEI